MESCLDVAERDFASRDVVLIKHIKTTFKTFFVKFKELM